MISFISGAPLYSLLSSHLQTSKERNMKKLRVLVMATLISIPLYAQSNQPQHGQQAGNGTRDEQKIMKEVRHELVMLPYYSVFDNLAYKVEDGTVTLLGQVTQPSLKRDAENVVKKIPGVQKVINNIEVLPPSPTDDQIRRAEFRAIYGDPALSKYAWGAVPPIHIIVNNGHVTLEGVVDNTTDKNIAEIRAKSVPGVFSVQNNLRVVSPTAE
jgi:hyperosmotically inducible protein